MEPAIENAALLAAALLCLLLVALASAVEAALAHVSRVKLRQQVESGQRPARKVDLLLDQPRSYSSAMTILDAFATTSCVILISDLVLRNGVPGGIWTSLVIAAPLILLLGHGLPRSLSRRDPERTAALLGGFAWLATKLTQPLVIFYDALMRGLLRLLRRSRPDEIAPFSEEEFTVLIGGDGGANVEEIIEEDERDMIDGVLRLEDRTVRDVMVPRMDVVAVPDNATLDQAVEVVQRAGHSRLPVYAESIDTIVGILYAKDLLRFVRQGSGQHRAVKVASLAREPYFVPESKLLDDLLHELQTRKVHLAVVADEYGGTAGLVTIEDILEEIVGEIDDEYDIATAPPLQWVEENALIADGRLSTDEVSELLDLHWTEEEHGTLSGLMQRELGRLPVVGETLDYQGAHLEVIAVDRYRLRQIRVEKLVPAPASGLPANGFTASGGDPAP